ncbi:hypothetical protein [Tateyamaria sp. syn59]|uniref:hypothetical protein n=1 Tax=Tateyamaria sp. syn59 TaxID=2576942 RepID=UPI0011BECAEE|nr:hypothetical protein [Tateyamaria sp. syn59]
MQQPSTAPTGSITHPKGSDGAKACVDRARFAAIGRQLLVNDFGISADRVRNVTFALFFPEAAVSRKFGTALEYLASHGFHPIYGGSIDICFDTVATIRSHDEQAPKELPPLLVRVMRMIFEQGVSPMVIMLEKPGCKDACASSLLSRSKGSVFKGDRRQDHLRTVLGSKCAAFKFLHAPDHSDALMWELGILHLAHPDLHNLMRRYDSRDDALHHIAETLTTQPFNPLTLSQSVTRTRDVLKQTEPGTHALGQELDRLIAVGQGDWSELIVGLEALGGSVQVDPWDVITLAAHFTQVDWSRDLSELKHQYRAMAAHDQTQALRLIYDTLRDRGFRGDWPLFLNSCAALDAQEQSGACDQT